MSLGPTFPAPTDPPNTQAREHDYLDFVLTPTTLNMYNLRLDGKPARPDPYLFNPIIPPSVTQIEGCIRAGKRHLGPIQISAPKRFIHVVLEGPEHGTETADSESLDASDSEFFWASPRYVFPRQYCAGTQPQTKTSISLTLPTGWAHLSGETG